MKGFALIEVLVALLLLSFGLLGIVSMQLLALKHTHDAYLRSVATTQIMSLMERLRVNHTTTARESELIRWNDLNAILLPQSKGGYHCSGNYCTVRLQWKTHHAQSLSLSAQL
jgi:type IV pilus assembly protein PilV